MLIADGIEEFRHCIGSGITPTQDNSGAGLTFRSPKIPPTWVARPGFLYVTIFYYQRSWPWASTVVVSYAETEEPGDFAQSDTHQFENNSGTRRERAEPMRFQQSINGMKAVQVSIGSDNDNFLYHVSIEKG